jgi:hypothetical protein
VIDLRLGRWEDALSDVADVDAVITDTPYSERTHSGHDEGTDSANDAAKRLKSGGRSPTFEFRASKLTRRPITYKPWTEADVAKFVASWAPRTRGWIVSITDHVLAPHWESALNEAGRYVFAPLPFVAEGSRVRLAGDGPSAWTCWIVVSRPRSREFASWGTLSGAYVGGAGERIIPGGKPLWLMRALVRDYTKRGDLIVDPCAGAATTLLAASIEGRRAIGAEVDPNTHELAMKRIRRGYTPSLDFGGNDAA